MKSTKDNWIKALWDLLPWFPEGTDSEKLKSFISQVEHDAIEKTNKRWRERVGIWLKRMKLECDVVVCDCGSKLKDWDMANIVDKALSDLLEDK